MSMADVPAASFPLHPGFVIGTIDPRLHGMFLEHLGRAIYGGIYEPGHPEADDLGFRRDVLALVRELGVPIVRYPGGNFVSGYNWEDGVGERSQRPRRLDLAWSSVESNAIGTNEFIDWCRRAGAAPMMAVNLGTRGVDAARQLVEYCNIPGGTALSDLRIRHGWREPHDVRVWCLGNEMDGNWQMGHKDAHHYGRTAREAAKVMKWTDPRIELVVCGSSSHSMGSFGSWERIVLEHCYAWVDYVSVHVYYGQTGLSLPRFLAKNLDMEAMIREVIATCDHVRAVQRQRKVIALSFDEWNVWYHEPAPDPLRTPFRQVPPLLEDIYTLADALVVGCMAITLLRHCDRVRIACLAQLVNVIAPIMTRTGGGSWRQTIWWPLLHVHRYARGVALQAPVLATTYPDEEVGPVPECETVATWDPSAPGEPLVVFAVARCQQLPLALTIDLSAFPRHQVIEHLVLTHPDPDACNAAATPDRVVPHDRGGARRDGMRLQATLPPLSWHVIRLAQAPASS